MIILYVDFPRHFEGAPEGKMATTQARNSFPHDSIYLRLFKYTKNFFESHNKINGCFTIICCFSFLFLFYLFICCYGFVCSVMFVQQQIVIKII